MDKVLEEALEKELTTLEQALGKTDVEGEGIIISLREKQANELSEDETITPISANDLIYISFFFPSLSLSLSLCSAPHRTGSNAHHWTPLVLFQLLLSLI